jgi:ATP-dependent helicase/DNAse subunit B
VTGIKEAKEIEDDMDNRVLGNLFHQVIEQFYKRIQQQKKTNRIEAGDLELHRKSIDPIIDEVFRDAYGLDRAKPVAYTGQRFVVREIVKRFALKIISIDSLYAPFQLEALEQEGLIATINIDCEPHTILLGGIIDRVDRKENVVRVVDYKTGKDELAFKNIESLFERGTKRNKAAFQTFIYAMLYAEQLNNISILLKPGLINRKNLFSENFAFGLRMNGEVLENVLPLLPEFKERLREMLNEMFDPNSVFDQTSDLESCRYCEFRSICYR